MDTCSRYLIRSFGASGTPPMAYRWKKRGVFLERMVAWLQFRGGGFIDRDLDDAVRLALRGLIQESAA